MVILGLSYVFQYNTSAVLLVDGELVAWSEEERHTRVKHAPCEFPHNAAEYVLNKAGLTIGDVDRIATTHIPVEEISKIRNSKAFAEYVGLSSVDWYGDYPYGSVTDPAGQSSGSSRVYRGGGWNDVAVCCRSAIRFRSYPLYGGNFGFGVALSPSGQ